MELLVLAEVQEPVAGRRFVAPGRGFAILDRDELLPDLDVYLRLFFHSFEQHRVTWKVQHGADPFAARAGSRGEDPHQGAQRGIVDLEVWSDPPVEPDTVRGANFVAQDNPLPGGLPGADLPGLARGLDLGAQPQGFRAWKGDAPLGCGPPAAPLPEPGHGVGSFGVVDQVELLLIETQDQGGLAVIPPDPVGTDPDLHLLILGAGRPPSREAELVGVSLLRQVDVGDERRRKEQGEQQGGCGHDSRHGQAPFPLLLARGQEFLCCFY